MSNNIAEHETIVEWAFRQAEGIPPLIKDAVVPVWCDSSAGLRILIGTAFFAERNSRSFLVTALHNFECQPNVTLNIEFSDAIWPLNSMPAHTSKIDDLWIAETCVELHELLQDIRVPLLVREDPESCRYGTGALLMGYPEELNVPGQPFKPLAISTTLETRELNTINTLPEPLFFNVQDEQLTTVYGEFQMNRPEIFGMSGGPVLSWYYREAKDSSALEFHYFLQGMILRWQATNGYVVACNAARITALLRLCANC